MLFPNPPLCILFKTLVQSRKVGGDSPSHPPPFYGTLPLVNKNRKSWRGSKSLLSAVQNCKPIRGKFQLSCCLPQCRFPPHFSFAIYQEIVQSGAVLASHPAKSGSGISDKVIKFLTLLTEKEHSKREAHTLPGCLPWPLGHLPFPALQGRYSVLKWLGRGESPRHVSF